MSINILSKIYNYVLMFFLLILLFSFFHNFISSFMFLVFVINSFMFNSDKAPIVLTAILLQLIYKFEYKMDQKTLQDLCGNITERTAVIKDWKSNHETIC